jgi:hypothetical protein
LRDLFAKDSLRMEDGDKPTKLRPEVSHVLAPLSFAGGTETLAGARTCPNRSRIGPSGKSKSVGPSENAAEEMTLDESSDVIGLDIGNGSAVNLSVWNKSGCDKFSRPGAYFGV